MIRQIVLDRFSYIYFSYSTRFLFNLRSIICFIFSKKTDTFVFLFLFIHILSILPDNLTNTRSITINF
ncbi:hypothetical protein EYC84_008319 [Monilinia fructicola]|uniref:Uncharacterized protein n=1 Tax=Monilinia fructicola TaxID=38448 RepID=A0A5M9JIR0_MONFR|nr:hypothetical protein EYC84_008319 [Monilinia fructicola]